MIKTLEGDLLDRRVYLGRPYLPPKNTADMAVLIFDIVGFSRENNNAAMLDLVAAMHAAIDNLFTPEYYWNEDGKYAGRNNFILIPTGDGYGVAFNTSMSDQKVLEIARSVYMALAKSKLLQFRMGVAKAKNVVTLDLNGNVNVFGVGIVLATRVCNAAETGQILIHEHFAQSLLQSGEVKELKKLPPIKAKHGLELVCYNYAGELDGQAFGLAI